MASFHLLRLHQTEVMPCPEYNRLRQQYEAALRHWGHLLLSLDAHLVGTVATKAAELLKKAFDERNAAKVRLSAHAFSCPTCNPRLRSIN
jgi:hypothetical protein